MTTTLRPTGPTRNETGGARARDYDICVNGRRVGGVEIATLPSAGAGTGTLRALGVDEADRRRGRGTVAALAAEEVLRGWGCDTVLVSVPSGAAAAIRLVTALGYTENGPGTGIEPGPETGPEPGTGPPGGPGSREPAAVVWTKRLL
ncbi:GNAT family N-acetyltransferase [Streptomyces sp. NPDC058953]|uniref:GNAT family N-acetyltransferase n=1 Tax=unclassified Streptomyces TaxID=2593676 RepID=UPI00368FB50B